MEASAADPVAMAPTTTASEANIDPIRATGTDALMAESRPEVAVSTDAHEAASSAESPSVTQTGMKVGDDTAMAGHQPLTEGILGYKAPGLVKSLRFSKKFFWFNDEAVEPQSLANYVRGEKPETGHANAAYASQTGKGLLFFAKRIEDKSQPAGILNLGEVSDITKEGLNEFYFKLHGHKHTFQSATSTERDGWLTAVETKASEAKANRSEVVNSEGYKSHINSLGKPSSLVAATGTTVAAKSSTSPHKGVENKVESDASAVGNTSETAPKMAVKSRSQSRKRQSIFGKVMGKKEDHDELKDVKKEDKAEQKEIRKEEKAEEKELQKDQKVEKAEEKVEEKVGKTEQGVGDAKHSDSLGAGITPPLDAAAIASRVVAEPVVPAETSDIPSGTTEPTVAPSSGTARETAPKPAKRSSVFGSLFSKRENASPTRERKEKETMPVVATKDSEPISVAEQAPQLDGLANKSSAQPAEEIATPSASAASPTAALSESKGGIFGFMKQKEVQNQEKKDMKTEEQAETTAAAPAMSTGTPAHPGSEPPNPTSIPNASSTTTAPDPTKEKRRQSFFGNMASKKERKVDATSDSEMTDGEGKKSAAGKLGGIFRKASRSTKGTSGPMTDSSAPPAPISKDTPSVTEAMPATDSTMMPAVPEGTAHSMGEGEKPTDLTMSEGVGSQQTAVSASA